MSLPYRAHVMGTRHMVVAGHYLAAQAGLQVLEAGGNAVDAGVAGGVALGVVLSEFVNFAGVAPIAIYLAERDEVVTISGLGWWPKAASAEYFRREYGGRIPDGVLGTVIPAAPDAWLTALERYGTMGFGEVAAAAIRLARDGFPISALTYRIIADHERDYARWDSNAAIYLPNGRPPRPGEIFVQADLARTLQYMVDEEAAAARRGREPGLQAARDAFYRGDIARAIADHQAENGGWLTMEDMAGFRVGIEPPVRTIFRDMEVYACGPWCQGPVLLQMLGILDGVDLAALGHNSAAYVHVLAEAMKLAFADRHRYYGDPKFIDVPMTALLDPGYAARRRALIRPDAAAPGMPEPGSPAELGLSGRPGLASAPEPTPGLSPMRLDTSYVCAVDRYGNAFSATPSDGSYSAPVVPGTGIMPSSRGTQSWTDPTHPSCLAPGKRPRLTPNPAIALRRSGSQMVMPFGSPGNDVQAQAMAQVFLNIQVFGMPPQEAVERPRFATFSYPRSTDPHEYNPGKMSLERRFGDDVAGALGQLGHEVRWWPEYEWRAGAVCTIVADRGRGVLEGGADPRRPTAVAGW